MLVLDRSRSIGENAWNTQLLPFVRALSESVVAYSSNTRVGVTVYPSQADHGGEDTSGNAAVVFELSYDASDVISLIQALQSQADDYCVDTPSSLEYPCSGWSHSPMWRGLQEAKQALYPGGVAASAHQTVLVVSDGIPGKSDRFNRATFLTLTAANELKSHGAKVVGVGIGGNFLGGALNKEDVRTLQDRSSIFFYLPTPCKHAHARA